MTHKPKDLSFKEIQVLLEKCKQLGVSELTLGSFCVSFSHHEKQSPNEVAPYSGGDLTQNQQAKDAIAAEEDAMKEDRMEQMLLEDPETYERLRALGELDEETRA